MGSQAVGLKALSAITEYLRTYDKDMGIQQLQTFSIIATHHVTHPRDPIPMREVMQATGLSQASISRNIASLADYGYTTTGGRRIPGLGWVAVAEDYNDRRTKACTLTAKGRAVMQQIEAIFEKFCLAG